MCLGLKWMNLSFRDGSLRRTWGFFCKKCWSRAMLVILEESCCQKYVFPFFSFFFLLFNLVVKDPSEKLSFMVDHFVFFKGLINEYVNMYRKKQKPISPSWKRETAFLLPWKTLELLVFGTCATGILRLAFLIDFIFHSNLLASISKSLSVWDLFPLGVSDSGQTTKAGCISLKTQVGIWFITLIIKLSESILLSFSFTSPSFRRFC